MQGPVDLNMEQLAHFIQSRVPMEESELAAILSCFRARHVRKEEFVLRQGQYATDYFFIQKGGIRIYNFLGDKDNTAWIGLENEFFADLSSLRNLHPSRFNFQAIEDTELLAIPHEKMEALYEQFPKWQKFGRLYWEHVYLRVIEEIQMFQTMTAEERYLTALARPQLLQRVPLKYLSSYLGITPSSLSRLRKQIK